MPTASADTAARPPILVSETEAEALGTLALAAERSAPLASRMLLEEIERADSCPAGELPADVVSMGAQVMFVDEATGATHDVALVYPAEADAEARRISILTPLGAGLIGLRTGQSIEWPNRSGQHRSLRIVAVRQPQTAAV